MQSCAKLLKAQTSFEKFIKVVSSCARLGTIGQTFADFHRCSKLWKVLQWCAQFGKLCNVMQSYAKLCKVMQSNAKLCKVMQSHAKSCKDMQSYAELCRGIQRCTEVYKGVQWLSMLFKVVQSCTKLCSSVLNWVTVGRALQNVKSCAELCKDVPRLSAKLCNDVQRWRIHNVTKYTCIICNIVPGQLTASWLTLVCNGVRNMHSSTKLCKVLKNFENIIKMFWKDWQGLQSFEKLCEWVFVS